MSQKSIGVFVSSKMIELGAERKALEKLLPMLGDETTKLHPWIFESDATASASSIRDTYMKALDDSELYIGLFWNQYGEWTIDEFHSARELGITQHIYVKDVLAEERDPRLTQFLEQQSDVRFGITPRWFTTLEDLEEQVSRSVNHWLLERQIAHHSAISAVIAKIPDDVPELPRRLIGRDDLVSDVNDLLDDNERILLRGFGGMGKSAIAATIAADRIEAGQNMVIWIRTGNADVDAIFEAIARAFDAQPTIAGTSGETRIQAIRHLLADKNALLVLDDVWNGNALAQTIRALPRKMPLLVTSRQQFPLDEVFEISELRPADALKMLEYHSRRRDLNSDGDASRLCETLGFHAFALEIAGKTLKVYDISPTELLGKIEATPHDLSMPAGFGELGRKGIRSLLDTSVDALSKDLLDAYTTLGGMFEPTSTPELLALVMQQNTEDISSRLDQLALRGLVNERNHQQVTYYRVHDLAYSYARTMFKNRGLSEQPVINACHKFTVEHHADLALLDIEQSNILEAAESAHSLKQDHVLIDIFRALAVDGPYFAARGHTTLSMQLLQTAITAATTQNNLETAHYLWGKLGNTYADLFGDLDKALEAYQKARELAQDINNPSREAILLSQIGTVRFRQQHDDADQYHEQAEAIATANSDEIVLSQILHNRGYQAMFMSPPDYERGREFSDRAAAIAERNNLDAVRFWSLLNRGGCEHELNQLEAALKTHKEAYELAAMHENYVWMGGASRSLGEDNHKLNRIDEAQSDFDRALQFWEQANAHAYIEELREYMRSLNYKVTTK